MSSTFTNVGEFRRGKGNRKTRLGPRIAIGATSNISGEKRTQSAEDIAIKKLFRELDKPGLTSSDKYNYSDFMRRAEQIRFMNMSVLAEVLLFMHDNLNEINSNNFSYAAIRNYVDRLLPRREMQEGGVRTKEISEDELEIMRLRMAATFLRYIRYVTALREQAVAELEQARLQQQMELAPALIDVA